MTTRQPTIYGNRAFVFIIDLTRSDSDEEQPPRRRRRRQEPQVIDLTRPQPEVIDLRNDTANSLNRVLGNLEGNIQRTIPMRRSRSNVNTEANKENIQTPTTGSGLQKNEMEAYCVKCKRKEPMIDAKEITTKNGRKAMSGKCAICGTKMMKFVKK